MSSLGARVHYLAMYEGALIALDVSNRSMAPRLAELTTSDGEAWAAIAIMRRAPSGDKVRLAIEWLAMRRHTDVEMTP